MDVTSAASLVLGICLLIVLAFINYSEDETADNNVFIRIIIDKDARKITT